ncbi:hypothetical protein [Psychromicrobium xiongbiense]|uniref:hypothetical protein n=1 Tax=Psychromicrobium xiongbiense TaxID=3051184 RepID=UPI0025575081|nr:hypothetical protein [Psychromicrobium sp. YIM S02556]
MELTRMINTSLRRLPVLVLTLLALLFVSACVPGQDPRKAQDFETAMRAIPGVASVSTGKTATIVLNAGLGPDAVETAVSAVGSYLSGHKGLADQLGGVGVDASGLVRGLTGDSAHDAAVKRLYDTLKADPGVAAAAIDSTMGASFLDQRGISIQASDSDFLGALQKAYTLRQSDPLFGTWPIFALSKDQKLQASCEGAALKGGTAVLDRVIAPYQAASAQTAVLAARLKNGAADLTIASASLVPQVFNQAAKADPSNQFVTVRGGKVVRTGDAGPAPTDALIADAINNPGVAALEVVGAKSAYYALPSLPVDQRGAAAIALATHLGSIPEFAQVPGIRIDGAATSSLGPYPKLTGPLGEFPDSFLVQAKPAELLTKVRLAAAVAQSYPEYGDTLGLLVPWSPANASTAELTAMVAALKPLAPAGLHVYVRAPTLSGHVYPYGADFTVGSTIKVQPTLGKFESGTDAQQFAKLLQEVWNAAS